MTTQDMTINEAKSGWGDLLAGKNAIYALALAGGVTLHAVNIYIVTTILPSVVRDIGGLDYYAWSTTLFVAASILGSALSARLLRGAGPRGAYGVAALLFAAGTLVCAVAPTMPVLLAGRFVQGFGGGFLYALAYSVIRIVLPEALWSRALGLISAMWGVSTLIGPAVGGVFAELNAWRAAFWSLIPLIALFGALATVTLPKCNPDARERSALPVTQLVLLMGAVLAASIGSVVRDLIWNVSGLVAALVLVALLIATEANARTRLLPAGTLKVSGSLAALYGIIALLIVGIQPDIFVPYFLQVLHRQPPLIAGYLAALMSMGWTMGSILTSGRTGAAGARAIGAGPAVSLTGIAMLAVFLPIEGAGNWLVLAPSCIGLLLVGLGIGLAWPHLVTSIFQQAPASEQSVAAAAITTVQLFAGALGAAAAGMVANLAGLTEPGGVAGTSNAAAWLFATFALVPAVCLLIALRFVRESKVSDRHPTAA